MLRTPMLMIVLVMGCDKDVLSAISFLRQVVDDHPLILTITLKKNIDDYGELLRLLKNIDDYISHTQKRMIHIRFLTSKLYLALLDHGLTMR